MCAIQGCFYEFFIHDDGDLVIHEEDTTRGGVRLQLLKNDGDWAKDLPMMLRDMHSHWLCRDLDVVVLRPVGFQQRETDFVIRLAASGEATCVRIPAHRRLKHWLDLLPSSDSNKLVLVKGEHRVLQVLSKFESPAAGPEALVHAYIRPSGGLVFDMPRFGLEFELDWPQRGDREQEGIRSSNFRDYRLAGCQQLLEPYTLCEFTRYLVLEPIKEGQPVKVIVPHGKVVAGRSAEPLVHVESAWGGDINAKLDVFQYQEHKRWKRLTADCISSRLQLAALYAATGTLLPEPRVNMTGSEAAMELLRQSFTNRPLLREDRAQLQQITHLSGLCPGLMMLSRDLLKSSESLAFLHDDPVTHDDPMATVPDLSGARAAYFHESAKFPWNARRQLTREEEMRVLGMLVPLSNPPSGGHTLRHFADTIEQFPVTREQVDKMEETLHMLGTSDVEVGPKEGGSGQQGYPLGITGHESILAKEMGKELRQSWDTHIHTRVAPHLTGCVISRAFQTWKDIMEVGKERAKMEQYLIDVLSVLGGGWGWGQTEGTGECKGNAWHVQSARMHSMAALRPSVSSPDIAVMVWWRENIDHFNPFLSEAAKDKVQVAAVTWLRLCVLEDKLGRLKDMIEGRAEMDAPLLREFQVRRTWDPYDAFPQWLVFEANSGLQVRPEQAAVARHMIDHPGDIVQLNMGEGKTRVVLPLLVLYWAAQGGHRDASVIRLHFLPTLIEEAHNYLHRNLCASVLRRNIFTMPFHRDVQLTAAQARAMRGCLERCRREGGVLLVTPEHRQSLHLKRLELLRARAAGDGGEAGDIAKEIEVVEGLRYVDILDESDELLHHRKQLIYAVGDPQQLPNGSQRAQAVQSLLRVIKHRQRHPYLDQLLGDETIAIFDDGPGWRPEAFVPIRLLPGPRLEEAKPHLRRELLIAILEDPPYEMQWMRVAQQNKELRDAIISLVTEQSCQAPGHCFSVAKLFSTEESSFDQTQVAQLLALRGLLAHGLLFHCLQKRERVEYGVARTIGAKKRLAIPFRASNTPALRSEWKHPDIAITLTVLSYYYEGLRREELRQALARLLSMGQSAQEDYYRAWFEITEPDEEEAGRIDKVLKLDLTNESQLDVLHTHFGRNFEVVNFWLNYLLLPVETQQFPKSLSTSAWFTAHNRDGSIVGFSGTKDNHRLLPLQVRTSSDKYLLELQGTDGKMLQLIMQNPSYVTLKVTGGEGDGVPVEEAWRALVRLAVREGAHALLDCGALLGHVTGREAAEELVSSLPPDSFSGVVFFRTDSSRTARPGQGEWAVLDREGRCVPLHRSPIHEREAFALFDEARCRGADLKLLPKAKALLTVGPKLGKDKLMQAAGRMRQLGRGRQSLVLVGNREVTAKICEVTGVSEGRVTSREVLVYAMANTVEATEQGLAQWASQGIHFAGALGHPDRVEQDEILQLKDMYGAGWERASVANIVGSAVERKRSLHEQIERYGLNLMRRIGDSTTRYGRDVIAATNGAWSSECERELELEQQEEEEVEEHVARVIPRAEMDWEYRKALSATSPCLISGEPSPRVVRLGKATEQLSAGQDDGVVSDIPWGGSVYATRNFLVGIEGGVLHGDYLRLVDAVLLFPSGETLLVSEREADAILRLLLEEDRFDGNRLGGLAFLNLSYAGCGDQSGRCRLEVGRTHPWARLDKTALASLRLFSGKMAVPEDLRGEFRALVGGRRAAVERLLALRGLLHMLLRSDVERLLNLGEGV
ncbi:unnamed protein product [Discosporangium mesarthrocarpum]